MKREDIPQDKGALSQYTKEVCYATDETGKYTTELSDGWEVKKTALETAWKDIDNKVENAKQKVLRNEASPLAFYLEKALMDIPLLAKYTGFWSWQIKQHLKPNKFNKLSNKKLQKYAGVFNVTIDELKNMGWHEE